MGHRLQQTAPLFELEQPQIGRDRLGTPAATIHFDLATANFNGVHGVDASITPPGSRLPVSHRPPPLGWHAHPCRQSPVGQHAYSHSIYSSTQPSLK